MKITHMCDIFLRVVMPFIEYFRSPVAQLVEHLAVHDARLPAGRQEAPKARFGVERKEHEERRWRLVKANYHRELHAKLAASGVNTGVKSE